MLNATVASQVIWALSTAVSYGTGTRAALDDWPAAGKTGTAQNNADATFAGFTSQRAAAIWVGYPQEQRPMLTEFGGEKVQGGTFPALIWHELMTAAMQGQPVVEFPTPPPSSTTTTLPEIPEEAIVPNLVGRKLDEETLLLLEEGVFRIEGVDVETSSHEPGTIFFQSPPAGALVPGGTPIIVEVAIEPELFPIPSVIGLAEADAKGIIAAAGFGVAVEFLANPDGGATPVIGAVWSQDPEAETEGEVLAIVTIFVEPEPPPPTTTTSEAPPDE